MAELIVARIDGTGIKARGISETQSARNEYVLVGHQSNRGGSPLLQWNGKALETNRAFAKGLYCAAVDVEGNVLATNIFDFQISTAAAFKTWMESQTGMVLMVSVDRNTTNADVNTVFNGWACSNWQYYWGTGYETTSFAGIFDPALKKIMTYQLMPEYDSADAASITIVFDTFDDIGTVGYGDPIVWDNTEYFHPGNTTYNFKTYISNAKLTNYGLSVGETAEVYAEVWRDAQAQTDNVDCKIFVQFYNNGTYVTGFNTGNVISTSNMPVNTWTPVRLEFKIPTGCNEIQMAAYRNPNTTTSTAIVACRDVVLKCKKPSVKKDGLGSVGKWGFITKTVKEIDTEPVVGISSDGQLLASNYGTLGYNTYGRLSGNGGFNIPEWFIPSSKKFSISVEMIWDVTDQEYMLTGQWNGPGVSASNDIVVGIRTENNVTKTDHEGHIFEFGNVSYRHKADIIYGDSYTYKIDVDGSTVKFLLNGVELYSATYSFTLPTSYVNYKAGGCGIAGFNCHGSVTEVIFIDKNRPANNRDYNFLQSDVSSTVTDSVFIGRSAFYGLEYKTENVTPSSSTYTMYCGVGSVCAPYGMQSGDLCYVTVLDWGTATPANAAWGNTRNLCQVVSTTMGTSHEKFRILSPDGGSWITAGNMNMLKVRVEYVAHPEVEATQENVIWITATPHTIPFRGSQYFDVKQRTNAQDFIIKIVRTENTSAWQYILDGRTSVNTTNGYLCLDNYGRLTVAGDNGVTGDFQITAVNGLPYNSTQTLELNRPYTIRGRAPRFARVGARYDGALGFRGYIWDISIIDMVTNEQASWINYTTTPFPQASNGVTEDSVVYPSYRDVDVHEDIWTKHPSVAIAKRNRITFTDTTVGTGIIFNGVRQNACNRILYDVTSTTDWGVYDANGFNPNIPIRQFPAGRSTGILSFNSTTGGVYIRNVPATGSNYLQLNKFEVFQNVKDGVSNLTSAGSYYTEFKMPTLVLSPSPVWVPKLGSGFINMPSWKPNAKNFRIRVRTVISGTALESTFNTILAGSQRSKSCIVLDTNQDNKLIRFFGYDASSNTQAHTLITVTHGFPAGTPVEIDITVKNGAVMVVITNMTTKAQKVGTGTWNGDGTEEISYIGYRPTTDRYNSTISLVELTDITMTLDNSRKYDLTKQGNIAPTALIIQPEQRVWKYMKIGQGSSYKGWDNTVYPQVGYMKDTHYVDGYKLLYIKNATDTRIKFENNAMPFGYMNVEFWKTNLDDTQELIGSYIANPSGTEYVIPTNADITTVFNDLNAYKKIVLIPMGTGSNLVLNNMGTEAWTRLS